ncbi:MAG: hypothetical protein NBV77_02000 [Bacteroidia bacterium]|nr:hypothetical protein [Bacteroidia bacterium]
MGTENDLLEQQGTLSLEGKKSQVSDIQSDVPSPDVVSISNRLPNTSSESEALSPDESISMSDQSSELSQEKSEESMTENKSVVPKSMPKLVGEKSTLAKFKGFFGLDTNFARIEKAQAEFEKATDNDRKSIVLRKLISLCNEWIGSHSDKKDEKFESVKGVLSFAEAKEIEISKELASPEKETEKKTELSTSANAIILKGESGWGFNTTFSQIQKKVEKFQQLPPESDQKSTLKAEILDLANTWLYKHPENKTENDKTKEASIRQIIQLVNADQKALVMRPEANIGLNAKVKEALTGEKSTYQILVEKYAEYTTKTQSLKTDVVGVFLLISEAKSIIGIADEWLLAHPEGGDSLLDQVKDAVKAPFTGDDKEKRGIVNNMKSHLGYLNASLQFGGKNNFYASFSGLDVAAATSGDRIIVNSAVLELEVYGHKIGGEITNLSIYDGDFDFTQLKLNYDGEINIADVFKINGFKGFIEKKGSLINLDVNVGLGLHLEGFEVGGTVGVSYVDGDYHFSIKDGHASAKGILGHVDLKLVGINYESGTLKVGEASIDVHDIPHLGTGSGKITDFSFDPKGTPRFNWDVAEITVSDKEEFEIVDGVKVAVPTFKIHGPTKNYKVQVIGIGGSAEFFGVEGTVKVDLEFAKENNWKPEVTGGSAKVKAPLPSISAETGFEFQFPIVPPGGIYVFASFELIGKIEGDFTAGIAFKKGQANYFAGARIKGSVEAKVGAGAGAGIPYLVGISGGVYLSGVLQAVGDAKLDYSQLTKDGDKFTMSVLKLNYGYSADAILQGSAEVNARFLFINKKLYKKKLFEWNMGTTSGEGEYILSKSKKEISKTGGLGLFARKKPVNEESPFSTEENHFATTYDELKAIIDGTDLNAGVENLNLEEGSSVEKPTLLNKKTRFLQKVDEALENKYSPSKIEREYREIENLQNKIDQNELKKANPPRRKIARFLGDRDKAIKYYSQKLIQLRTKKAQFEDIKQRYISEYGQLGAVANKINEILDPDNISTIDTVKTDFLLKYQAMLDEKQRIIRTDQEIAVLNKEPDSDE